MDETYILGSSPSIYTNLEETSQPRYYTGGRQGIEIEDLLRQMSESTVRPEYVWLFEHGVWLRRTATSLVRRRATSVHIECSIYSLELVAVTLCYIATAWTLMRGLEWNCFGVVQDGNLLTENTWCHGDPQEAQMIGMRCLLRSKTSCHMQ